MAAKKKNWIAAGASKHPGLFASKAKSAGKSTAEYAQAHHDDSGKLGKEARFAANAMRQNPNRRAHRLYGSK